MNAAPAAIAASPVVLALVDELGDIEQELAPLKAKIKRAEVLRSAIRAAYKDAAPGESFTLNASRWSALLGPCGNESVVDLAKLHELAGAELFLSCASVSLKSLQEKCSAEIVGSVVSTRLGGSRPLNLYGALVAPAIPRAAELQHETNRRKEEKAKTKTTPKPAPKKRK